MICSFVLLTANMTFRMSQVLISKHNFELVLLSIKLTSHPESIKEYIGVPLKHRRANVDGDICLTSRISKLLSQIQNYRAVHFLVMSLIPD